MSVQITTAMVKQYGGGVDHLCQQKGSRLRSCVNVETGLRGKEAYFDQIGVAPDPVTITSRHQDTQYQETPHARRRVTFLAKTYADLIDNPDKVRTLIDPSNEYTKASAFTMGRGIDDVIIAAANGTAYTGVDGGTSVALPSAQKVAAASAGLTIAKLRAARKILTAAEVDPEEELFCWVTAAQIDNLLATTEVGSYDYNSVKALVQGEVDTFMGFKFVHTERLGLVTTSVRAVIAHARSGIKLGILEDVIHKIDELPTKNYSVQVYSRMDVGATRMEESKVVEIACLET